MTWAWQQHPDPSAPWFMRRRTLAAAVAGVLFAVVFVVRVFGPGTVSDGVSLLYVLPVALLALAFGRVVGLGAGVLAVGLVVVWAATADADLTWVGWVSRVVPLLLVGGLLGDAAERQAQAQYRQRQLEAAAQRHRDAAEISDGLIQGMAAAKWALESGRHEKGLELLEATLEQGHALVTDMLREADLAPGRPRRRS